MNPVPVRSDIYLSGNGDYSVIQSWRLSYFGTHEDTGDAANTADYDLDGVGNPLEFAFGMDPIASSVCEVIVSGGAILQRGGPAFWLEQTPAGVDFHVLFVRRKDDLACGLTYTVQFSADLATWENSSAIPEVVTEVIASDAEMEAVAVTYPVLLGSGKTAQYSRVQVTLQ